MADFGPMPERSTGRPRVLYVVSLFHPFASGAERQALAQGMTLARRGHEVHVVTRSVPGYPVDDEEYEGVFIHRWIRPIERGPLFGLTFVASVLRALGELRGAYDIVHTHQALWEAVATGIGLRMGRLAVPALVQPASAGFYGEAQELGRTRGHGLLRRAILANTHFAAISSEIEREWLGLGVAATRLTRMASGVDADRFCPGPSRVELQLLPRPRVIYTGRLHPQKSIPLLLEAWREVAARSRANLILVGPGPDRRVLEELARGLGIAERVQFVGAVENPADYLRGADVFVLPSVAEGMSNSLLEAMASALPAAVSGIGGNTDLVRDGETGRVVGEATAAAWARVLLELIEDPVESRRLGQNARAVIEADYALEVVVDRYLALYSRLAAGV